MSQVHAGRVRFGGFEVDLRSGELCPVGTMDGDGKTLLREQSLKVLRMLIESGGRIVTREEIKGKLWPNDTVVDFDHSINTTVKILRRALSDSADNPQYIQTLARRGYRLLVSTEWLEKSTPPGSPTPTQALPGPASLIGRKVSHYRVLEVIGGGGMGMVYRAEDLKLGRRVALKFLPEELANDPVSLRRLEREAQTASSLNHPNICTIYAIEEYEGQPFIVMELLEGDTLLHREGPPAPKAIQPAALLGIAIQICHGLQAAHDKGIIHRDIKPTNIFLTKEGPVKILDFGLAKLASLEMVVETDPSEGVVKSLPPQTESGVAKEAGKETSRGVHANLTRTGIAIGTARYMSPEQVRKEKLDARTDLFSFGLVLYEMATGRRAFTGETTAMVHDAILNQTPSAVNDLNSTVPRGLDSVIAKALEKDRWRRYQSAAEMQADLERVRREMHPVRRRLRRWLASAELLVVVAAGAWTYRDYRNRVTLSADDTIVIADVNNQTSDPVFDDALKRALFIGLEQTPYLSVLASDKVSGALRLLNLPGDAKVTPEIARQVCLRTNSKIMISSSIADAGNRFRIELDAIACQSGNTIARVREDASRRNEIVRLLGVSAAQLRGKLGEPSASIAKFNKPLEQATSPSPEAIQQLEEGYRRHVALDLRGAIQNYEHAIELDPDFGLAYAALGAAHGPLGESALAATAYRKAFELRTRLTELARFNVEEFYYDGVTGEQEKAYAILSQWVQTFPRDVIGQNNLSKCLVALGQPERAADGAREAARLLATPFSYQTWMLHSILADRLEEATAVFDEAQKLKFDPPYLRLDRVWLAFVQKDEPAMQEQWKWAAGKPGANLLLSQRSHVEAYYGHFREARHFAEQAIHLTTKSDVLSLSGRSGDEALEEAGVGNLAQAQRLAARTLAIAPNRDTRLLVALAFARAGDIGQAQRLVDGLSQDAPLNTVVQKYCLPTIRAAMKLHENDPAGAVEVLRPTVPYDLAYPNCFNDLYPAYIRGLAYLQMGEGRLAAAEFQKLFDHPGIVGTDVIGALAYLQLARAQKVMGDQAAARKSYEDFLTLWKNADSDIPIYQQAKAEYAGLRKNSNSPF